MEINRKNLRKTAMVVADVAVQQVIFKNISNDGMLANFTAELGGAIAATATNQLFGASEEEKDNKVDVIAISVIISALVAGAVVFISGVSIDL